MVRAVTILAMLAAAAPSPAVQLRVSSAEVAQPGDVAEACVTLDSEDTAVAGVQNDLVWDGACATLASADDCRIDPATGKELFPNVLAWKDFALRALVLSLTDVDPIPDGRLYCCDFRVMAQPRSCCTIGIEDVGAADPDGNALAVRGSPGDLCVGPFDGTPATTQTPTFTPATTQTPTFTPTRTPSPQPPPPPQCPPGGCKYVPQGEDGVLGASSDGDGCQLTAAPHSAAWPSLLIAAALLLLRRRR